MFSNKFDVGIVYVFKVAIIKIFLKFLLIKNNKNFQFFSQIFGTFFIVYILKKFALFL
jgi:hypothetical protein